MKVHMSPFLRNIEYILGSVDRGNWAFVGENTNFHVLGPPAG